MHVVFGLCFCHWLPETLGKIHIVKPDTLTSLEMQSLLVTGVDSVCCWNCCFIFISIYPGFPFRLQLMIMNKLPRAWWKLFSFEKSILVLPTIASQEQHLSICVACKMKNGGLKMKCIQVNILVLFINVELNPCTAVAKVGWIFVMISSECLCLCILLVSGGELLMDLSYKSCI